MDTPNQVKILKLSESSSLDANGMLKSFINVQFTVGGHGPFYESMPKSEYNGSALKQKIDTFVSSLQPLTNAY